MKQVYLVGGAVRDKLLGKSCNDLDYVVVGSSPAEMLTNGFKQVGAGFPVFLCPDTGSEYALARTERKTGAGYNGFITETVNVTLEEDLARRDFTINAMAEREDGTLVDPFNGQQDLKDGIIRHVTGAFEEDPVRILRAARFAARYKFKIADETIDAARTVALSEFDALPAQRIFLELKKAAADDSLQKFLINLAIMKQDHVLSRVLCKWELFDMRVPVNQSEDILLAAMCLEALRKNKPLADFQGMASHRELATRFFIYSKERNAVALLKLVLWASGSRMLDLEALVSCSEPDSRRVRAALRFAAAVVLRINSTNVLESDPTLEGPALGAAIKAKRLVALEMMLNGY